MGAILSPTVARGQYPPGHDFLYLRTVCWRAALGVVPNDLKMSTACINFPSTWLEGSFGKAKLAGRVGFHRQIPIYVR